MTSNSQPQDLSILLPNNPSFTTEDPLGLSDAEEYPTPVWPILESYLLDKYSSPTDELPPEVLAPDFTSTISDLSYTLHNLPDPHLEILKSCLITHPEALISIRHILRAASRLPVYFPSGILPALTPGETRTYTAAHIQILFSLQFLLTLPCPSWNDWGGVNLSSWYSDVDGKIEPKRAYVNIALEYAAAHLPPPNLSDASKFPLHSPRNSTPPSQNIHFHLCHCPSLPNLATATLLVPLNIIELPIESDFPFLDLPNESESKGYHTTYIISSHRLIGHGPAATQEERILASVPELLPVSTFTPPLEGNTALAVTTSDPRGFIPTAAFVGHGRTAKLDTDYSPSEYQDEANGRIRVNTFLFLNATELDTVESPPGLLPDLFADMLEADLLKAYTGFSRIFTQQKATGISKNQRIIATPWGTGAFGGDIRIKLLILWIAASFAALELQGDVKVELVFMVKQFVLDVKEDCWREVVKSIIERGVETNEIWGALRVLRERGSKGVFAGIKRILAL
ncbi:hypothetical protein ABW19_dt0202905 [Dactylella cylindrospora]|nr:hypothetical protein ABW19_dt0202905 [Dactylella cylindrospora]